MKSYIRKSAQWPCTNVKPWKSLNRHECIPRYVFLILKFYHTFYQMQAMDKDKQANATKSQLLLRLSMETFQVSPVTWHCDLCGVSLERIFSLKT